jgi:hypothetical protein
MTSTLRRRAAEGCLSRRERKATKEMLNLKGEIGSVMASVKDGNLDRNDAAAMIRGYRASKGFVEVERRTKEQEEPEGRVAKLRRALEATESARGTEAIVKGPEIEIKGNYPTALVSGKASKDAEYLPNPNIRLQHRTART